MFRKFRVIFTESRDLIHFKKRYSKIPSKDWLAKRYRSEFIITTYLDRRYCHIRYSKSNLTTPVVTRFILFTGSLGWGKIRTSCVYRCLANSTSMQIMVDRLYTERRRKRFIEVNGTRTEKHVYFDFDFRIWSLYLDSTSTRGLLSYFHV